MTHNLNLFLQEIFQILKSELLSDEFDFVTKISSISQDDSDFLLENVSALDTNFSAEPPHLASNDTFLDAFFAAQDDLDSSLCPD